VPQNYILQPTKSVIQHPNPHTEAQVSLSSPGHQLVTDGTGMPKDGSMAKQQRRQA
jgi:hypothetical protein